MKNNLSNEQDGSTFHMFKEQQVVGAIQKPKKKRVKKGVSLGTGLLGVLLSIVMATAINMEKWAEEKPANIESDKNQIVQKAKEMGYSDKQIEDVVDLYVKIRNERINIEGIDDDRMLFIGKGYKAAEQRARDVARDAVLNEID